MEKRDIDVQIISGGVASMPEEQQEKVKDIVRAMYRNFPDLFDDDPRGMDFFKRDQNSEKTGQSKAVNDGAK